MKNIIIKISDEEKNVLKNQKKEQIRSNFKQKEKNSMLLIALIIITLILISIWAYKSVIIANEVAKKTGDMSSLYKESFVKEYRQIYKTMYGTPTPWGFASVVSLLITVTTFSNYSKRKKIINDDSYLENYVNELDKHTTTVQLHGSTYQDINRLYYKKNQIPLSSAITIVYRRGLKEIGSSIQKLKVWVDDDKKELYLASLEHTGTPVKYSIPIEDIIFFTKQGDFYTKTNVEGGGSSLGGALVGGVLAGGAGAIIGSRKEVKTTTESVDKRETILAIKDGENDIYVIFSPEAYDVFLYLLPHKEINFIEKSQKTSNRENDILNQIERLSQLKQEGILTEREFNEKKKILLEKIS